MFLELAKLSSILFKAEEKIMLHKPIISHKPFSSTSEIEFAISILWIEHPLKQYEPIISTQGGIFTILSCFFLNLVILILFSFVISYS